MNTDHADAAEQLDALADDVRKRGFAVEAVKSGHRAGLSVTNRSVPQLSETVYLAPDDDGCWWFWWSWDDRLAPIEDLDAAAFKVAYVLTPHG
jgi:streptogramin lyase